MAATPSWALSTLTLCPAPTQALARRVLADAEATGRSALWLGSTLRPSDPYPDHRDGYGIDFLVAPQAGLTGDLPTGDWLASQLIAWHQAGRIRLRSFIWWRRRWTPERGWHPYTGSWPHTDHVHVWLASDSPSIGSSDDTPATAAPSAMPFDRLAEDGLLGPRTIDAIQWWVGASRDGLYGPQTRRGLQAALGVTVDGIVGRQTVSTLQRLVGASVDGIWGPQTTRALQAWLNRRAGY